MVPHIWSLFIVTLSSSSSIYRLPFSSPHLPYSPSPSHLYHLSSRPLISNNLTLSLFIYCFFSSCVLTSFFHHRAYLIRQIEKYKFDFRDRFDSKVSPCISIISRITTNQKAKKKKKSYCYHLLPICFISNGAKELDM